jgi:hypothetical protein
MKADDERRTLDERLLSRYSYDTSCLLIQRNGSRKLSIEKLWKSGNLYQHAFLRREHVLVRRNTFGLLGLQLDPEVDHGL